MAIQNQPVPPIPPSRGAPPPLSTTVAPPRAAPPVTAGSLIGRTMEVWWRNIGKLAVLMLVGYVPIFLLAGAAGVVGASMGRGGAAARGAPPDPAMVMGLVGVGLLAVVVLVPIFAAMMGGISYGVIQHLSGRPVAVGGMLGRGFRRVGPLLLTGLLVGLAIMGGYLLLIVPGIMIATATAVALPTVMGEPVGASGAFSRSLFLTRGHRWSLLAAFIVVSLVNVGVSLVANVLSAFIPLVGIVVSLVATVFVASLPLVLPAVAYHDLRVNKEGVDTAELARVFG